MQIRVECGGRQRRTACKSWNNVEGAEDADDGLVLVLLRQFQRRLALYVDLEGVGAATQQQVDDADGAVRSNEESREQSPK